MTAIVRTRRRRYGALALVLAVGLTAAFLLSPGGTAGTRAAPTNTAEPAITGTAGVGQTLTASTGTWTGSPTSFAYQWVRCPASGGAGDGSDCAAIGGATTVSYVVAAGDVGFRLRVRVTATNADGSAIAASNATAVVVAAGPANTTPPTISGGATVGSTLTANPGTWTPATGVTFAYQWRRCDASGANCSAISGATTSTYVVTSADVGSTLRVAVTGTDATGSNTVVSAQTSTIAAAPAPPTGCPNDKSTKPINVSEVSPPAHLVIDKQAATPQPIRKDTQTIVLRFHVSACGGRSIIGALVYETPTPYQQFSEGEQPTGADGWATLTLHRLRFFPASKQQQLLVVFVRARKSGEDLLGGISARRLVSFKVNLKTS